MKTSNKILLGLIVVVFAIPFLFATSLKAKIKKGEFTIQRYNNNITTPPDYRSGSLTAAKVIKVTAPHPELLTCHLKLSDSLTFNYTKKDNVDSLMVYTANDTLFVKYIAGNQTTGKGPNARHESFNIELNLAAFDNLVVDGSLVIIDSQPGNRGSLSVIIRNNGMIKDGSTKQDEDEVMVSPVNEISKSGILNSNANSNKHKILLQSNNPTSTIVKNETPQVSASKMRYFLIFRLFNVS